jgi:hypothetical protein
MHEPGTSHASAGLPPAPPPLGPAKYLSRMGRTAHLHFTSARADGSVRIDQARAIVETSAHETEPPVWTCL